MNNYKIFPSILSADFGNLTKEIELIKKAGADGLHIDVMDGHFVPNITIGPFVVKAIKEIIDKLQLNLLLDVHLMIDEPSNYIQSFVEAGADIISVHVEATKHLNRTLNFIKKFGKKSAIALNPATSLFTLDYIFPYVDMILIMSVNPGFAGQEFIENSLIKIKKLKEIIDKENYNIEIEVDGGVKIDNIGEIAKAGANIFVAGSAIFKSTNYAETISCMKEKIENLSKNKFSNRRP